MANLLPPYTKTHIIIFGSLALLASFTYLFLTTNNFSTSDKPTPSHTVTISSTELESNSSLKESLVKVQDGKGTVAWSTDHFVILDIRPEDEFNQQHLTGAQNAPLEFLKAASLNPDVDMVVYSNKQKDLESAAAILTDKNIRDIYLLFDTLEDLRAEGYTLSNGEDL